MSENDLFIFNVYIYRGQRAKIQLPSSATIEDLKLEIHKYSSIRPSKQVIRGWHNVPENHDIPVKLCTTRNNTNLLVINSEEKMDLEGDILNFFLVYRNRESVLQLSEYYTVEVLKIKIQSLFGIPPHKQVIEGWKNYPESDSIILKACIDDLNDIIFLVIEEVGNNFDNTQIISNTDVEDLEVEATVSFINKILNNRVESSVTFHTCRLENAISESCLAPLEKRKSLLLYLHNENDPFTFLFCENLKKSEITEILNRDFFLLGWDIEETKYQSALVQALNKCNALSDLVNVVNSKVAAALFILPIEDSVMVFSCLRGNVSYKDFLTTLTNAENFLITERQEEKTLQELKETSGNKNDMGSENYQKLMADMLGDRDYDSFEFNQHEHLKMKIAFALLGPPQNEDGYEEKYMNKDVEHLYKTILKNSNKVAKYKDKIEISFIYNCTEPLPSEKLRRAKKYNEYNPNTDLSPLPIFVLRKCRGSENPCRVFVDHMGRTYDTWMDYKSRNKIVKSEMILPRNGRYEVNENGDVLLDRFLSPDCGIDAKLLQSADIASTVGGIISGGLFVTAAVATVAPAALLAGGVLGLGIGIYSISRSAYILYDRNRHKETLSFANSEARGAYLNIVAGSLGFVGAGANMAVSQLAVRGVNIGKGAGAVVNTIGIANIGASGVSVLNSGYDVFDQWYNENQTPSLLTIVQLSSSILFFGNAVYNFRTCSTIVEETQTRTLQEYQESLRSNRHRKTFTKLLKETIRQNNGSEVQGRAEVISAIRNIQNKDEVFALLTRSNKNMNKLGVKFSAVDGEIQLNGRIIDINEFTSMNQKDTNSFLLNMPKKDPTPVETMNMRKIICKTLNIFSSLDIETLATYAVKLLSCYDSNIKSKIIDALASLLANCTDPIKQTLDEIFPNHTKYLNMIDMIVAFFSKSAEHLEDQYKMWMNTHEDMYFSPFFEYVDVDKLKRTMQFFETSVNMYYTGTHLTEQGIKELLNYFYNWLAKQLLDYQERTERNNLMRAHSATSPTEKKSCSICGGYYYMQKTK